VPALGKMADSIARATGFSSRPARPSARFSKNAEGRGSPTRVYRRLFDSRPFIFFKSSIMKIIATIALALSAVSFAVAANRATCVNDGTCPVDQTCAHALSAYVPVATALAADDLAGAQSAAKELTCWADCHGDDTLATATKAFTTATSLDDARTLFKDISASVIPLAENDGAHFVMTCPMAKADWIQTDATVANPYYGSQMLRCGSVKRTIKPSS
jgi:Protein of unknown function (DUF3347)